MTAPILRHEVECRVGFVGEFGYRQTASAHTFAEITLEADHAQDPGIDHAPLLGPIQPARGETTMGPTLTLTQRMLQLVHPQEPNHSQHPSFVLAHLARGPRASCPQSILDQHGEPRIGHPCPDELQQSTCERPDRVVPVRAERRDLRLGDFRDATATPEVLVLAIEIWQAVEAARHQRVDSSRVSENVQLGPTR